MMIPLGAEADLAERRNRVKSLDLPAGPVGFKDLAEHLVILHRHCFPCPEPLCGCPSHLDADTGPGVGSGRSHAL